MAMNNSLAEVRPELVPEWSEKNLPLKPDEITFGSNKKVWWKGTCGHEWQASVKARSNGEKCPICSGARVIAGINDLATLEPLLVKQWSKKNKIKPTEVSIGSHKKVIWRCEKGHEWEAAVKSRTINKTGCPYCSHNKVLAGFNDLATLLPDIAAEWSDRNCPTLPTQVTVFANRKAWWKCKDCGREWNTLISTRSGGSKCPYCSGYIFSKGFNDLQTTHPEIASEWSEKNLPLKPDEVNAKSRKNVWWRCSKCGNEWKSVINARVKGTVYVYSKTLEALRIKEEAIEKDKSDGIKAEARYVTLDDLYELWKDLKRGLKNNTFENYKYIYETFVRRQIGSKRISTFLKSDIKRFYNYLVDERGLKPATVDGVHNILHQIFDMAVDDNYIRNNPTNNVLRELKKAHCFKTEKRRGLTRPEQELFMDYLKNSNTAVYWYPVFAVMLGTGLRVGEVTGLRWCDIDLEDGIIDVNHTLVYYDHRTSEGKKGCYFNVNTPKTEAGNRQVPMLDFVKEAFVMEKERQELLGVHCEATIDGYTDFIFLNRFGQPQHQSTLNKAIRRIIRDCNDEQFLKTENPEVLLPHFSCHSLRHTFTTRMCEAGVNIKVIQDTLGHKDITTTLNIYTDVTKELKRTEFDGLDKYFNNSIA